MKSTRPTSLINVRNIIQLVAQIDNFCGGGSVGEKGHLVDWICACLGILILIINDQVRSRIGGATGLEPNSYDK